MMVVIYETHSVGCRTQQTSDQKYVQNHKTIPVFADRVMLFIQITPWNISIYNSQPLIRKYI